MIIAERLKKVIQGQLKRSWITELYLEHHAISFSSRQPVDISSLCSQCVRKEHSYPFNTSMASNNGFQVTFLCTLMFNSSMTMRSPLNKSINRVLVLFLHCTSMLTIVESFPQVLFAVHLYSPA